MELVYRILEEIPSNSSEILNFYALKNVYFRTRMFFLAHKKNDSPFKRRRRRWTSLCASHYLNFPLIDIYGAAKVPLECGPPPAVVV